jgi:hypothetical protein
VYRKESRPETLEKEKNRGEREEGRSQELAGRGGGEDLASGAGHAAIRFACAEPRRSVAQRPCSYLRKTEMMREESAGGEREERGRERQNGATAGEPAPISADDRSKRQTFSRSSTAQSFTGKSLEKVLQRNERNMVFHIEN